MKKKGYLRRSISDVRIAWHGVGDIGFLLRRARSVREAGQTTLCMGLFFLLFFSVVLVSYLQMEMVRASSAYMEDAIAASGLASALIDVQEYGSTHVLRIPDVNQAYERYCTALKANLGLDEKWECHNKRLIFGRVTVENYTVYNVTGDSVSYCSHDGGREHWSEGKRGSVFAPNGQVIERTGVYGEISYSFTGVWGLTVNARKGKLVDVVGEE